MDRKDHLTTANGVSFGGYAPGPPVPEPEKPRQRFALVRGMLKALIDPKRRMLRD
jgi:hypothetical protein